MCVIRTVAAGRDLRRSDDDQENALADQLGEVDPHSLLWVQTRDMYCMLFSHVEKHVVVVDANRLLFHLRALQYQSSALAHPAVLED